MATQMINEREDMVEHQLRARGIADENVLRAMRTVARERFIPDAELRDAYWDGALPIGQGQTISQPYIVARMCEAAHVSPGSRILDVGTGSGYQAAVLAEMGADVVSIEREALLADHAQQVLQDLGYDNVTIIVGDGSVGYLDRAPYDAIIVAAASPAAPAALLTQLKNGGRLVIPVGARETQRLRVYRRVDNKFEAEDLDRCIFVPLIGEEGWSSDDTYRRADYL